MCSLPSGDEESALRPVAALDGLAMQPLEERAVALEGGDHPFVDRPLHRAVGPALQSEQHADEGDLAVLALLALAASRLWILAPPIATISATAMLLLFAPPPTMLTRADHRRAAAVHLDDEHLTIVLWDRHLGKERAGMAADRIDDSKGRARARRPLEERRHGCARLRERHLRAEARERGRGTEAEAATQAQYTIEPKVGLAASEKPRTTSDATREGHLAEARAQIRRAPLGRLPFVACVQVATLRLRERAARQEEHDDRPTDRQHPAPRRGLELCEPALGLGAVDQLAHSALDGAARLVDTRHRGSFRWVLA